MIRKVKKSDLELLRKLRNKWHHLGIFRQDHNITVKEQEKWFKEIEDPGVIINDRAYGKIFNDNEIAFYGFDEWLVEDVKELMVWGCRDLYYGECYQCNPFLVPIWLEAGFKVVEGLRNRKYWNGAMYDSLLLKWEPNEDIY